jgi:exosortase
VRASELLIVILNGIATDMSQFLSAPRIQGLFMTLNPRLLPGIGTVVAILVLGLAYARNFRDLVEIWSTDPNYSHGYLVIPIALFILWRRLSEIPPSAVTAPVPAHWWGCVGLVLVLAFRAMAYERNSEWLETATMVPAIACLAWSLGSWPLLARAWPAIVFLVFLFPLPAAINDLIALPLQRIAATGSCFLLQLSGFWAIQDGNVINLTTPHGVMPLDVALACNGLRMLMTMAATITATIILLPLPTWKRLTLLVSTVPVAMVSNIIRIFATGWCYYFFTGPTAKQWAHDMSGLLMMPLALALVGLELRLMSWLAPVMTKEEQEDEQVILPVLNPKPLLAKKKNDDLDELA